MKKLFGLLLIAGIGISANANTTTILGKSATYSTLKENGNGIHFFKGSWEEALAKAKAEKKIIFLDAYASWCGPCKIMSAKTFTTEEVGSFFNTNFINYKMDMEKAPQGNRLASKFQLHAYPTLYFINHNENLVHEALGYKKPKQLISIGKSALKKK